MKRIKKYLIKNPLLVLLLVLFLASCDDDVKNVNKFILDKEDITIGELGGVEQLAIMSSSEWVALSSEPWVMISPANGLGSTECSIVIDSTLSNDMRTATLRFIADGHEPKTVTIRQTGFDKMIVVEEPEVEIEASERPNRRRFSAVVTTNVEFEVKVNYENGVEQWLTPSEYKVELDRGARPRTAKINFNWRMNSNSEQRIANVSFIPVNEDDVLTEPASIKVTQKAAPTIEDNRAGDSLAVLIIAEKLRSLTLWETSENISNWVGVTLWEETDKDLPEVEAIGRVRSVGFTLLTTQESIPQEIRYLKYLENLEIFGNANTMQLSIDLGPEITELTHIKYLEIGGYGLVSLPPEFVELGKSLVSLDLSGNNFSTIPSILNQDNFPNLKSLSFSGNRRWTTSDLSKSTVYENGLGLNINIDTDESVKNLFLWSNLEALSLSYNYIEGSLPEFNVGDKGVEVYTEKDITDFGGTIEHGDTIRYLLDKPKVLPNMKRLGINLNFMTGDLPEWILYHPHLLDWFPDVFIFNQMEYGLDSKGRPAKFNNVPNNFDDYYEAFPLFKGKYEFNDVYEDEE